MISDCVFPSFRRKPESGLTRVPAFSGTTDMGHSERISEKCRTRRALGLQSGLGLLDDSSEGRSVGDSKIREDLSVQCNLRLFQSLHKAVVREAVQPGACANPSDPQPPKISFPSSAVSIRVDKRPLKRFFCLSQRPAAAADKSLGSF
jgi:hypothetical protein